MRKRAIPVLAMHPALRNWRDELFSVLLHLTAYGGGLAAAAAFAIYIAPPPKVIAASEPIPQPEWLEVEKPYPAFALSIPEAGDAPSSYVIQRHAMGGGRKDILSLGKIDGNAPYLRVEIYRPGKEIVRFGDTGSEIAARAAKLGAAEDVSTEADLETKFGPLSLVNFSIRRDNDTRKCTGFVRAYGEPRLQIAGVFCQSGSDFVARSMLTCALDRLTLNASGGDPKTGALFAQAELRRSFCGQRNTLMAPTPKYPVLWKALEQRQQKAAR
jgi:hypothetical protein